MTTTTPIEGRTSLCSRAKCMWGGMCGFLFGNMAVPHLLSAAVAAKKGHLWPPSYTRRMSASRRLAYPLSAHRLPRPAFDPPFDCPESTRNAQSGRAPSLGLVCQPKGQTGRTDLEVSNGVLLHHPQMPARPASELQLKDPASLSSIRWSSPQRSARTSPLCLCLCTDAFSVWAPLSACARYLASVSSRTAASARPPARADRSIHTYQARHRIRPKEAQRLLKTSKQYKQLDREKTSRQAGRQAATQK